jgi:PIN domain nuclease of toxin-antitoxin system
MRLLLDSHILLAVTENEIFKYGAKIGALVKSPANEKMVSVASLWEIAIKHGLGKLSFTLPLERFAPYFEELGFDILQITPLHAVELLHVEPGTSDPFDRLLLAQCQIENMRLVTVDRSLADHPLVWREP